MILGCLYFSLVLVNSSPPIGRGITLVPSDSTGARAKGERVKSGFLQVRSQA
jgi:hypothetical protein